MTKVTKFKSRNLFGETRAEEKRRLIRQMSKAIVSGKTPTQVNRMSSCAGTTKTQRVRRRKLTSRKCPTIKDRLSYL